MPSLRRQLDPRLHIAAAIGWAVFGVVTLAALVAANLASNQAERRARSDAEGLLAEFATQVRDALSMGLETRRSMLQATAAQIASTTDRDPATLRRTLLAAQSQFPEFTWLGVADAAGHVVADTGSSSPHTNVSALPWFRQGSKAPFVSDPHATAIGSEVPTGAGDGHRPPRLIDAAAPLRDGGALGAFLAWTWVEQQLLRMQLALNKNRQVELLLVARDGTVLVGPPNWSGRSLATDRDATEGGDYVTGSRANLRLADNLGLGWTTIVRQRAELALAPARTTGRMVFLIVFVAGLLAAAMAVLTTRLLTRRLSRLAADAEAVRFGDRRSLAVPAGHDEVSRIGATLSQVVNHLQSEKQAMQTLNTELDRRVAERTLRIARMADEARHAAVTRERLRIARDLHDTLAHSLMALLTQIRLVRKLRGRMGAAELDEELGRAEGVATTGLCESRAAIAQMRDNGVRDTGLGAAVQDLTRRFSARTGVAVALESDETVAKSTDERAETVFRIIEEALRNVERHAGAQTVCVGLRSTPNAGESTQVNIEVSDDGVGFDPALPRPGHYGLRGIHEQAALIGARLDVLSQSGKGTRIVLTFDA
jgi:signal transduction histidine kinase